VDFDDIDYFTHADLLYDLAGQMVRHLRSYLSESEPSACSIGSSPDRTRNSRADDGPLLGGGDRVRGAGQSRLY
jgi:hypothetical protein